MRFYLVIAFGVLGFLGFGLFSTIAIFGAIGLTLLTETPKEELKSAFNGKLKLATIISSVVLLLFGHWILAIFGGLFYVVYIDKTKHLVKMIKSENKNRNKNRNTMENENY